MFNHFINYNIYTLIHYFTLKKKNENFLIFTNMNLKQTKRTMQTFWKTK